MELISSLYYFNGVYNQSYFYKQGFEETQYNPTANGVSSTSPQVTEYITDVSNHWSTAEEQLNHLKTYMNKYGLNSSGKYMVINKQEDSWGSTNGKAWINAYQAPGLTEYSCGVASDNYHRSYGHECGHNLGADHVNITSDIMYTTSNSATYHYSATNINNIKSFLKL